MSLEHVSRKPGLFAVECIRRMARFWTGFWSFSSRNYLRNEPLNIPNVPFCTALTLLTVFGLRSLFRQYSRTGLCFLAVMVLFPLPYYLTHASVDYRQPIEPEIVVLIAAGSAELCRRWQVRRDARAQLAQGVLVGS